MKRDITGKNNEAKELQEKGLTPWRSFFAWTWTRVAPDVEIRWEWYRARTEYNIDKSFGGAHLDYGKWRVHRWTVEHGEFVVDWEEHRGD